jgi:Mce-associated membrane protein
VTQPPTPLAPSGETTSAGIESTEHRIATPDYESGMIEIAQRSAPDDCFSARAEATDDDAAGIEDESVGDIEAIDPHSGTSGRSRGRFVTYLILPLPLLVMGMAVGAGYLKYQDGSVRAAHTAAISSVQAATEGTIALLSYGPDTAQTTLTAARGWLTGPFRDSYTSLTNEVVIPGAKQKRISATATVPAASSVSASENHAVVLIFVDQSVIVGNEAPSATASAVRVTLDKTGDRWLISGFDPK